MTTGRPPLLSVPPGASAEEVAAMVAVVAVLEAEQVGAAAVGARGPADQLDAWVQASRVSARRTAYARGSWRLAGRLARRSRA